MLHFENYNLLEKSYYSLLEELDSPVLAPSITKTADSYFNFIKALHNGFETQDFSNVLSEWNKFDSIFESNKINPVVLGNILNESNLDYSTFKTYLNFVTLAQEFISLTLFDLFFNDINSFNQVKENLPTFFIFSHWLNKPHKTISEYMNGLTQEHIDSLQYFNSQPELEFFIDKIILLSKSSIDDRDFDNLQYYNFNMTNLHLIERKQIIMDTALKGNTVSIPEQFIDYVKYSIAKFQKDPNKRQSVLEVKDLHEFLQNYEMYKLEKLFPVKHIKLKTNKI